MSTTKEIYDMLDDLDTQKLRRKFNNENRKSSHHFEPGNPSMFEILALYKRVKELEKENDNFIIR